MQALLSAIRELGSERLWLLGVITTGHSIVHWFQQLFPVILPSIKAGLGISDVQVGALATARQLTAGILNLPTGLVADSLVRYRAFILASQRVHLQGVAVVASQREGKEHTDQNLSAAGLKLPNSLAGQSFPKCSRGLFHRVLP